MKAIILAAGLGSRLKNITSNKPKALVEVNDIPMLEIVINNLKKQGVNRFLINIHHFGDMIIDFLKSKNYFDVDISISDERAELLNTGGAILKAHDFVIGDEPVLVHNVDIISDVDILSLYKYHIDSSSIATLCVRKRNSTRGLYFNKNMHLAGWANLDKNQYRWVNNICADCILFAFSGIYIISPAFVKKIEQKGEFSIIDTWLTMAKSEIISGYEDVSDTWHDLGTVEKINAVVIN